jgi:hypothetical protein
MWILPLFLAIALLAAALVAARGKCADKIVLSNLRRRSENCEGIRHIFFCFADHFEPLWGRVDRETGIERVANWCRLYPAAVDRYRDGSGRPPQHSCFYPQEEYIPECIDRLAGMRDDGFGDVEIHLHHDGDSSAAFRDKIETFRDILHNEHGLLHRGRKGGLKYGFIHGNWALDDSGLKGRWCGVKDEITILKETGCYADFTYPSAPHRTQPPVINQIYHATDDPGRPKSHHRGIEADYRSAPAGDLLLITGPLALNWRKRKKIIFPAIENGDITSINPPTPDRVDLWVRTGIHVRGWPKWIFIKIHTHGLQPGNAALLLGGGIAPLHERLLSTYNDGDRYRLHYVTARECYICVRTLEEGDADKIRHIENYDYSG